MNLKRIRLAKKYTQKEAAVLVGVPLRTYKRYELDSNLSESFKYEQICKLFLKIPAKPEENQQKPFKISVIGAGYVGLSISLLLAERNDVTILDIDKSKIEKLRNRKSYINEDQIEKLLNDKTISFNSMCVNEYDFSNDDFVIVATSTDFDKKENSFDMSSVNESIKRIRRDNKSCLIVIKSTIPLGFTKSLNDKNVIFCPEFLKEGNSIKDNLFPSRIVIGADKITNKVKNFAKCLQSIALNNPPILYLSSHEAESIKLFSNAYLAMRVAFFNELDTYAHINDLNTENIIKGVCLDPRIGDYYNNPSFGYGGYCLPKDTIQLDNSFLNIPNNNIIRAIVESNVTRKNFIFHQIVKMVVNKAKQTIGFYKVSMKKNSDNVRGSSSLEIANKLIDNGYRVIIYDNNYKSEHSVSDFKAFIKESDIIIANRITKEIKPYLNKVFTRDKFENN